MAMEETGIQDPELLRLYEYKRALEGALSELALTRAVSVSISGRSITRQSSSEIQKQLGLTDQKIRHRLAYLAGNRTPYLETITFRPGVD